MTVKVRLSELLDAHEWVCIDSLSGAETEAYVRRIDGQIFLRGEGLEDDCVENDRPADLGDEEVYASVPDKRALDLGSVLVLRFVRESLPDQFSRVQDIFRARGAYSRFKALLERAGKLEAWYRYEQEATEQALCEWCEDNGFVAVREPAHG